MHNDLSANIETALKEIRKNVELTFLGNFERLETRLHSEDGNIQEVKYETHSSLSKGDMIETPACRYKISVAFPRSTSPEAALQCILKMLKEGKLSPSVEGPNKFTIYGFPGVCKIELK